MKGLPLWCILKGCPGRNCVVLSKVLQMGGSELAAAPQHRSLSLGHLGGNLYWLCNGFTYNDKSSPSNSQKDSQMAHAYQLIPVSLLIFLKPKITFPLIHQP